MPIRIISFGGLFAICLPLRKIGFPQAEAQTGLPDDYRDGAALRYGASPDKIGRSTKPLLSLAGRRLNEKTCEVLNSLLVLTYQRLQPTNTIY